VGEGATCAAAERRRLRLSGNGDERRLADGPDVIWSPSVVMTALSSDLRVPPRCNSRRSRCSVDAIVGDTEQTSP